MEHYIESSLHLEVSKSTLTNVEGMWWGAVVIVMAPPPSKIVFPLQYRNTIVSSPCGEQIYIYF